MAVETTATSASFTGTGVSSTYAPGFYANSSDQVVVTVDGIVQTLGDDYVVNNVGASTGCDIVGIFPLGAAIYVERVTPITQLVDTQNNETILEDVLDAEFDKLTMIAQELGGRVDRAVLVPKGSAGQTIADPLLNPGKYLATDAGGNLVFVSGSGADSALRTDLAGSGLGSTLVNFISNGVGAAAMTVRDKLRKIIHQTDFTAGGSQYANAKAAAGAVAATAMLLVATPQTNAAITGAKLRPGIITGHMVIGGPGDINYDPDAYVGLFADELYVDPGQEMRGVSYTIRQYRTTPDEATLGWDIFALIGAVVIDPRNTQFIRGNMKAVVGELIFQAPNTGSYTALTSHCLQAVTIIGNNVTLTNWYGLVVGIPGGSGTATITNGYGIFIDNLGGGGVAFTNPASIRIAATGNHGRIWWGNSTWITQDASGKMEISYNNNPPSLLNVATSSSATAGAATALPATPSGYKHEIIGGVLRKFPYYN